MALCHIPRLFFWTANRRGKMKSVSYVRVSTEEQKNGDGPERQVQGNVECEAKHGLEIYDTLKDIGYSASKGEHISHGALGKYLKEADKGLHKGEGLIAERQDRLSRLGNTETTLLFYRLITAGVTIFLHKEDRIIRSIKDLDEMGMAIQTTVRSCSAQEYSQIISERVGRAWITKKDAALASHTPFGKSLPVWLTIEGQVKAGNRIVNHGKIIEVTDQTSVTNAKQIPAATVRKMFTLAAQGVGSMNILQQLNESVLSRSWVVRTLSNRAVLGEYKPKGRDVIQGYYPQIVSQSEFDAARAKIKTKTRHGNYAGGNRKNSLLASNLFEGRFVDITTEPIRSMQFQDSRGLHYVMSALDNSGRRSNRIRYDKLEKALLGFLETVTWEAIAEESDSDEYRAAKAALEAKRRLADALSREITANNEAMVGEDADTRRQFMRQNAKNEVALATLTSDIEALKTTVDEAQAKTVGLAETRDFRQLLSKLHGNPALRLPARAAIQQKVDKIELVFMPDKTGVVAFIRYTNGALDTTTVLNKDINEAAPWFSTMPLALRTSSPFRILRFRNREPEFHADLKADALKWVRSFAAIEELSDPTTF
jgi:DNA invertase Pin-like site-specific DNA recombinase